MMFAKRIKQLRNEFKLTQREFAGKFNISALKRCARLPTTSVAQPTTSWAARTIHDWK